jgi:hypothetical protein
MGKAIHTELKCTQAAFEGIHADLDRVRSTSTTVKVDKAALAALLMDHAKLISIAERAA